MIEITITADNADAARQELRDLLGENVPATTAETPVESAPAPAPAEVRGADKPTGGKRPLPPTKKTVEFAEENGVELDLVTGTGKDGRITKADVERFLAENPEAASEGSGAEKAVGDDDDEEQETEEPASEPDGEPEVEVPDPDEGDPTLEQARAALMKLNDVTNLKVAKDMVRKFGVGKIQDLDPKRFRAFINDCNQAIRAAKSE